MKRNLTAIAAAVLAVTSMSAAPAFAAPVANPAASLSVAKARAATPTASKNKLGGGAGFFGILIAAGVIAIGVIAIVKDDNSDSN